jgi:hypothetical protein
MLVTIIACERELNGNAMYYTKKEHYVVVQGPRRWTWNYLFCSVIPLLNYERGHYFFIIAAAAFSGNF